MHVCTCLLNYLRKYNWSTYACVSICIGSLKVHVQIVWMPFFFSLFFFFFLYTGKCHINLCVKPDLEALESVGIFIAE